MACSRSRFVRAAKEADDAGCNASLRTDHGSGSIADQRIGQLLFARSMSGSAIRLTSDTTAPHQAENREAKMGRMIEGYFHLLKIAIVLCLVLMVVLVFGNVVLRYAFNMGLTTSEELSRFLFVWLTFLGAIVALREHGHLGVDMLVRRLPAGGKKFCLVLSILLMLYVTWLLLQGSWQQTVINLDVKSPAAGISMALLYGVGVVFALSAGPILLYELYRVVSGKLTEEELVMVKESEEQEELEDLQRELAAHGHDKSVLPVGPATKSV
jgi:TRAP-type C4-dicarboxylate transport system permease small subunit